MALTSRFRTALLLAAAGCALLAGPGEAEETAATAATPPGVTVEEILVEPAKPAADTLCRLAVRLTNHGDAIASQLAFKVTINGQDIPVYGNHLWMMPLPPGTSTEMSLYNFWSTETSRPMPKNGKLDIVVSLLEAQEMKIEDVDGVETWTPLGAVAGLPSSASLSIEMNR